MDVKKDALLSIGNTPIVKLNRIAKGIDANVFIKLEFFNPTGSYKDRMALAMIEGAERRGQLRPGGTSRVHRGKHWELARFRLCGERLHFENRDFGCIFGREEEYDESFCGRAYDCPQRKRKDNPRSDTSADEVRGGNCKRDWGLSDESILQ